MGDEGVASASTDGRALGRECDRRGRRPQMHEMDIGEREIGVDRDDRIRIGGAEVEAPRRHAYLAAVSTWEAPARRNLGYGNERRVIRSRFSLIPRERSAR